MSEGLPLLAAPLILELQAQPQKCHCSSHRATKLKCTLTVQACQSCVSHSQDTGKPPGKPPIFFGLSLDLKPGWAQG